MDDEDEIEAPNERKTGKACSACNGDLVEEIMTEYRGDPMNMIFGPGSADQMTRVHRTSCERCGLMYRAGGGVEKRKPRRSKKP